ncbi:hypothetical protein EJ110_NYTH00304 [Nymphaea thermarum]|nr:hypothetical protein EJ110_NYTH00304 [Nymphaea thermarum]
MIKKERAHFLSLLMALNHHNRSFLFTDSLSADASSVTPRTYHVRLDAAVSCKRSSRVKIHGWWVSKWLADGVRCGRAGGVPCLGRIWHPEGRRHCALSSCCSLDSLGNGACDSGVSWSSVSADPDFRLARLQGASLKVGNPGSAKLVNRNETYEHGGRSRFLERPVAEKIVVAVDLDEVLGSFLSALNIFLADRYALSHSVSEYHVYEFAKIWNCSPNEASIRVHEFFKTSYFKAGIHPIPGAQQALVNLSKVCKFAVVTSRQNVIKEHTLTWIERHYPGLFQEVHFGNHFALDGKARPKSEICRSLGADVLIDDNPRYALECAEQGIKVLLFDYLNAYPWCKNGSATLHPLVTKVYNWEEVQGQLLSWQLA